LIETECELHNVVVVVISTNAPRFELAADLSKYEFTAMGVRLQYSAEKDRRNVGEAQYDAAVASFKERFPDSSLMPEVLYSEAMRFWGNEHKVLQLLPKIFETWPDHARAKQALLYHKAVPDGQAYVFYTDMRSDAKGFEEFCAWTEARDGRLNEVRAHESREP